MIPDRLDCQVARELLDFSGNGAISRDLAEMQLEGAVALYNAIRDPKVGVGYLADEVGMGKTYIALGVVALMRFFNPSLKVLYVAPSENVQSKWIRDYRSFIANNVLTNAYRVRGVDGSPVAPHTRCDSLEDLIRTASSGFYADFFVRNGSFSFGLSDDPDVWFDKLETLEGLLPAFDPDMDAVRRAIDESKDGKGVTKDQYAQAINYVLPDFDLVVIDEAHNFKKGFDTSSRNRVLSQVLGMRQPEAGEMPDHRLKVRVKNALLLSATPYDRNLDHLRNQLALVGKKRLLPGKTSHHDPEAVEAMDRFMVRRLNRLVINGEPYTRNMYRTEWRTGGKAEMPIRADDRKLVTALVQKKVGDMLGKKHGGASFQMGLLASFESYAETTKSPKLAGERSGPDFDSDNNDEDDRNVAADREVVAEIADSYADRFGRSLPHPKMDEVADRLAEAMFERGEKQLVFVRRVKSVKEIKQKLDERYDAWLKELLRKRVSGLELPSRAVESVVAAYEKIRGSEKQIVGEDELDTTEDGEQAPKPKNDNLFNWWFRGASPAVEGVPTDITPNWLRERVRAGRNLESLAFEINWAGLVARRRKEDVEKLVGGAWSSDGEALAPAERNDYPTQFGGVQSAILPELGIDPGEVLLFMDDRHESSLNELGSLSSASTNVIDVLVQGRTFFEELDRRGLLSLVFPALDEVLTALAAGKEPKAADLQKVSVHQALISTLLRTGHGIVDLYLSFLRAAVGREGGGEASPTRLRRWVVDFVDALETQLSPSEAELAGFSTGKELQDLAARLDTVVRLNVPDVNTPKTSSRGKYLSDQLNPIAPVLAASGEISSGGTRSAQARKFRMPGYPLALVSTNVFQEGEDLHLFCDSVVHYGISQSPVSIEQKNGRVDRIGSLAQERLKRFDRTPTDEELIQVFFPHIPESIERLQIRQLCGSMNEYIRSLQDVDSNTLKVKEDVDAEEATSDRSGIEPQNRDLLQSRFKAKIPPLDNQIRGVVEGVIATASNEAALKRHNCDRILEEVRDSFGDDVRVEIRSARASGELLLSVIREQDVIELANDDFDRLLAEMLSRSWRTLHRTVARRDEKAGKEKDSWRLVADAELLLGDESVTQEGDVRHLLGRLDAGHDPSRYRQISDPRIEPMVERLVREGIRDTHLEIPVEREVAPLWENGALVSTTNLVVTFPRRDLGRRHRVALFECDGDCVMLSWCATADRLKEKGFSANRLVELTWQRNARTDIVEFMLDPEGNLVGRCVHPIESMHFREFEYCVHTLAAECDRLEYVVDKEDRH